MENNKLILGGVLIVILVLVLGGVVINFNNSPEGKHTQEATTESNDSKPTNKTDTEAIVDGSIEGAKIIKSAIEEARESKLHKDSLRKANRRSKWVYQIGLPTNNSLHLFTAYNQLQDVSNIKVFKSGRKSYFLYKDDGYSEEQIKDSLSSLQAKLRGTGSKVEIIDLMSLCSLKEDIVKGEDIKVKKEDVVLLCNTCD